jgi:KDO2-lipid IV(A) lauroyltransferase
LIDPADYEKSPDAVRAITQRFTSDLERLIRLAPEQYFWLHRRWKHQPLTKVKAVRVRVEAAVVAMASSGQPQHEIPSDGTSNVDRCAAPAK